MSLRQSQCHARNIERIRYFSSIPLDTPQSSNGLSVAFLEEQAEKAAGGFEGQHIQEENDDEGEEMEDSEEDVGDVSNINMGSGWFKKLFRTSNS